MKKIIIVSLLVVLLLSLLLTFEKLNNKSQYERIMASFIKNYAKDKMTGAQLIDELALYYPIKEVKTVAYLGPERWIAADFSELTEDIRILYTNEEAVEKNLYCQLGDIARLSAVDELTYHCLLEERAIYDGEGQIVGKLSAEDFFNAYDGHYAEIIEELMVIDSRTLEIRLKQPVAYLDQLLDEHFGPFRVSNEYHGPCYLKSADEEAVVLVNAASGKTVTMLKMANAAAYRAYRSGDIDFMKLEPFSRCLAQQDGLAVVERQETIGKDYLFFNMRKELPLATRQLLLALLRGEEIEPETDLVIGVRWADNSRFKDVLTERVYHNSNQRVQLVADDDGALFEQYLVIDDHGVDSLFYDLFLPHRELSELLGFSYEKD